MTPRRALPLLLAGACAPRLVAGQGPRAVLLRGLAGVFSTGVDRLVAPLAARGFEVSLRGHLAWESEGIRLRADPARPVVAVGHSLGADAALALGGALAGAGVPVPLVAAIDPVFAEHAPQGVGRVLLFRQTGPIWGRALAGPQVETVEVPGFVHFAIDADPQVHARLLAALDAL